MKISRLERSSSHTNGAVIRDSTRKGRDISHRDRFGRPQGELLRNDLANDQRHVGRHEDHQTEANGVRGLRFEAERLHALSDRLAQARARKGASENGNRA